MLKLINIELSVAPLYDFENKKDGLILLTLMDGFNGTEDIGKEDNLAMIKGK